MLAARVLASCRWARTTRPFATQSALDQQQKSFRDFQWEDARDRGRFADLQEYTNKKGVVHAPWPDLLPCNHGIDFPTFPVYDVADLFASRSDLAPSLTCRNRVTLLGISFRESGRLALQTWLKPFAADDVAGNRQYIELAIIENLLHRLLVRNLFSRSVRSSLQAKRPPSLQSSYLFCFEDAIRQLVQLHIRNRLAGYVFLLDGSGCIRWRASGSFSHDQYPRFESYVLCLERELRNEIER